MKLLINSVLLFAGVLPTKGSPYKSIIAASCDFNSTKSTGSNIQHKVMGAIVYFQGADFKNVERGTISSSSFKTIKSLMERCVPGTIVLFNDVRVAGPDNIIRAIAGISLVLY